MGEDPVARRSESRLALVRCRGLGRKGSLYTLLELL